ncbi:MAG TPA: hypothetical protein VHM64_23510, partial [Candidatus Binatia bacterium]|nr:hypothetical protein [Candidatus Binatia bacterium]
EIFNVSANGRNVSFTRNIGNIVMDLDHVEIIELNALGGADTITVNDLSGTDMDKIGINLAVGGIGDGLSDMVIVNATESDNTEITVSGSGDFAVVKGLHARVEVGGADAGNDSLIINSLGGNDRIDASAFTGVIQLGLAGGNGEDTILGGADVLPDFPPRREWIGSPFGLGGGAGGASREAIG